MCRSAASVTPNVSSDPLTVYGVEYSTQRDLTPPVQHPPGCSQQLHSLQQAASHCTLPLGGATVDTRVSRGMKQNMHASQEVHGHEGRRSVSLRADHGMTKPVEYANAVGQNPHFHQVL
jgi:hypothetical protein